MVEFQVGRRVTVTDGAFATLEAEIDEVGEDSAKGTVRLFGIAIPVLLAAESDSRVSAVDDRSALIARYADAPRYYGVVGRIVSGAWAGKYIRVDRTVDLAETPEERADAMGVVIRTADDAAMTTGCVDKWVEDWAGVEESLRLHDHVVDWNGATPSDLDAT